MSMTMGMTKGEQIRLNACYANLKSALDELALIQHKDSVLIHVQHQFYTIEDILHQYVGPYKKEVK